MKKIKIEDYLELGWTYSIECELHKGVNYYVIHVNQFPGVCTHHEDLNEGMKAIKEALSCAIELHLELGKPIPFPATKKTKEEDIKEIDYREPIRVFYKQARA
jgi:predicted RNase H-like HicB family nuclease